MTIHVYKKGQKVQARCEFKVWDTETAAWVLTDPTTVTCKVRPPSGSVSAYVYGTDAALGKESTGVYVLDLVTNATGEWFFRFEGTGACVAVEESAFKVKTAFP